jgi:hypothetical protein
MTLETDGSVQAGNPDGSTAAGTATGSGAGAATDWTSGLQIEDNRKTVAAKGWKDPDTAIGSYRELERYATDLKSKALVPPKDDASPDDWNAFWSKLGRPEKPEAYEFKLPEGLPDNLPYDGKTATEFKVWAHEAGLTPKQAQAVHDKYVGKLASTLTAKAEADSKAANDAHETLLKEWGDGYKRKQELANRAIRQLGGDELVGELKSIGALGPNGEVITPRLAVALSKTGEALYAEDTAFGGPRGMVNPFSDASENLTEQGRIIRNDPDLARAQIRAAGKDPKEWSL